MDTARKKGLDKTLQRLMKTDRVLRRVGIDLRKAFFSQVTSELGEMCIRDRNIAGTVPATARDLKKTGK